MMWKLAWSRLGRNHRYQLSIFMLAILIALDGLFIRLSTVFVWVDLVLVLTQAILFLRYIQPFYKDIKRQEEEMRQLADHYRL